MPVRVEIEALARHIDHLFLDGIGQQPGRVDIAGQAHPEEHAAFGPGEADTVSQDADQGIVQGCATRAVGGAYARHVLVVAAAGKILRGDLLDPDGAGHVVGGLGADAAAADLGRRDQPAHAQARRHGLGHGRGIGHPGTRLGVGQGDERGHLLAAIAQLAVGIVLDQQEAVPGRQLQQLQAALAIDRGAARVGERSHDGDDLGLEARGHLVERLDVHAFRGGRHAMHPGAGVAQRLAGIGKGRILEQGVVARPEQHAGQQGHAVLRPAGDHDLVGRAADAALAAQFDERRQQAGLALDIGVLQEAAQIRHDPVRGFLQALDVEQLRRRIAARQGHRARPRRIGRERTDGRNTDFLEWIGKNVVRRVDGHDGGEDEGRSILCPAPYPVNAMRP